jgi:maltose O-acetyltransferase
MTQLKTNLDKVISYRGRWQELARLGLNLLNARWRLRKCTVGPFVQVLGNPRIINMGELIFGEKVIIDSITARAELVANPGARLEIGERTYINYGTSIAAHELVKIGKYCRIGTYCNIADNDFHGIEDRMSVPPSEPVILEDNVWLGAKVIVLKGVTIGHDSVIGAGSVVTKNIPPRSIAVGMPARVIRTF